MDWAFVRGGDITMSDTAMVSDALGPTRDRCGCNLGTRIWGTDGSGYVVIDFAFTLCSPSGRGSHATRGNTRAGDIRYGVDYLFPRPLSTAQSTSALWSLHTPPDRLGPVTPALPLDHPIWDYNRDAGSPLAHDVPLSILRQRAIRAAIGAGPAPGPTAGRGGLRGQELGVRQSAMNTGPYSW